VFSQLRKPVWACARHARFVSLCTGAMILIASTSLGSTISVGTLNNWQWNGFTRTSFSKSKTTTSATSSTIKSSATTSSSSTASPSKLTYSALAASTDSQSASLAGLVYYDANANGTVDSSDWAIYDAKVTLKWDTNSSLVVYTGSDGTFKFSGLVAGTYSINLGIDDT